MADQEEPSMEGILANIRSAANGGKTDGAAEDGNASEDTSPVTPEDEAPAAPASDESTPAVPSASTVPTPRPSSKTPSPIVSEHTAEAARDRLDALSRLIVKPEQPGGDTLEGLVREMLRPMLSEWLEANLPRVVESLVAREISRITEQMR